MISPKERAAQPALSINRSRAVHRAFAVASVFKRTSKMSGKRPRQQLPPPHATRKGPRLQAETQAETSQHQVEEKITVAINANLLKCCVCFGPLTPPIFKCTKGHISCSRCCTEGYEDDEVDEVDEIECLMCRDPETATRCRTMEHILGGLHVPCPFQQHGCAEMIPYTMEQAHKALCAYAPLHCPISGCAGYVGMSLREHVRQDHPGVVRTVVSPCCLRPLRMRVHEQARVVRLSDSNGDCGAEFLIVIRRYKELGRALSVVHLVDELVDEQEFKHKIEVVSKAGVLSMSGETLDAERLTKPYEPSLFLFVPNETWDSPRGIRVFIELE